MAPWDPLLFNVTEANGTSSPREHSDESLVVTQEQLQMVMKSVLAFRLLICLGGILANLLNIRTFLRMGLRDSVTIAFFNLAVSDLLILVTALTFTGGIICVVLENDFQILFELKPIIANVFSISVGRFLGDVTALLTAFLAVQRCLCVVIPLHFKGVFTRLRTMAVVATIWGFCLICGGIWVSQYEVRRSKVPDTNSSIFVLFLKPSWNSMATFYNIILGIFLNTGCIAVVFVSLVIMVHSLRKSVQFRQASTIPVRPVDSVPKQVIPVVPSERKPPAWKEHRATVQVFLVSAIFVLTCTPYFITSVAELLVPGLGIYEKHHNVFSSYYIVRCTIENLNSAVNFFVYFKYNTKFRQFCFK